MVRGGVHIYTGTRDGGGGGQCVGSAGHSKGADEGSHTSVKWVRKGCEGMCASAKGRPGEEGVGIRWGVCIHRQCARPASEAEIQNVSFIGQPKQVALQCPLDTKQRSG